MNCTGARPGGRRRLARGTTPCLWRRHQRAGIRGAPALGERVIKGAAVGLAALGAAGATFVLLASPAVEPRPACPARVALSFAVGTLCALLVLCVCGLAPALLGAAALGAVAHYAYAATPLGALDPPFTVAGLSGLYLTGLLGSAALGAIVACRRREWTMRAFSAMLGAGGVAAAAALMACHFGARFPGVAGLLVVAACTVAAAARGLAARRSGAATR